MDNSMNSVHWGDPVRTGAAFDFRSDVVTTPSLSMLTAIRHTSLHDDVYCEDDTTAGFERDMASRCGHEAAAFVLSGTMANQLALRALLFQPPHAILTDASSHIIHWEAGGVALLSGAMVQAIKPSNGKFLTVEDVRKHAAITSDVHKVPTRIISLENPTSGTVIPLSELKLIKQWATANDIGLHLDGARLWEAVAASGSDLKAFAQCCDVLTLDFSKNLGAPMGAMVLGAEGLIQRLKRIRKAIGGGMRQAGVLAAAAQQAIRENFGTAQTDTQGKLQSSHRLAQQVAAMWTERGGKLLRETETNMTWLDLRASGVKSDTWNEIGKRHGIKLDGKRVVLHHQICQEAMDRLGRAMDEVFLADVEQIKTVRRKEQEVSCSSINPKL